MKPHETVCVRYNTSQLPRIFPGHALAAARTAHASGHSTTTRSHFYLDEVTYGLRDLRIPGGVGGVSRVVWGQKIMENTSVTLDHHVYTEHMRCEQRFHSAVTEVKRHGAHTRHEGPTPPHATRDRPDRPPTRPSIHAARSGATAPRSGRQGPPPAVARRGHMRVPMGRMRGHVCARVPAAGIGRGGRALHPMARPCTPAAADAVTDLLRGRRAAARPIARSLSGHHFGAR